MDPMDRTKSPRKTLAFSPGISIAVFFRFKCIVLYGPEAELRCGSYIELSCYVVVKNIDLWEEMFVLCVLIRNQYPLC